MKIEGYIPNRSTYAQVIEVMTRYARKDSTSDKIVDLANRISSLVHPSDNKSKMIATLNWIKTNLSYTYDHLEAMRLFGMDPEDIELVKSPLAVLESGRYDCDCIATFIASIFLYLGVQVRFVIVGFDDSAPETEYEGYSHVYAQGFDESSGTWVVVDPVSHPDEKCMILDTKRVRVYPL